MVSNEEIVRDLESDRFTSIMSDVEKAINTIMVAMSKEDDNRKVCFSDLEGNLLTVPAAEAAIERGKFCACAVDES